jgi:hypothetical protein
MEALAFTLEKFERLYADPKVLAYGTLVECIGLSRQL